MLPKALLRSGHTPSDMTILITAEGGIRMVADSDWPLDSLQAHHGARMAYRVSQSASIVRVEGRAGSRTCLFETAKPERAARLLLNQLAELLSRPVAGAAGSKLALPPAAARFLVLLTQPKARKHPESASPKAAW